MVGRKSYSAGALTSPVPDASAWASYHRPSDLLYDGCAESQNPELPGEPELKIARVELRCVLR